MSAGLIELCILVASFVGVLVVVFRFICSDLPDDFLSRITRQDKGGK